MLGTHYQRLVNNQSPLSHKPLYPTISRPDARLHLFHLYQHALFHNPPSPRQAPTPSSSISLLSSAVGKADPRFAALTSETLGSPLGPGMASRMAFCCEWISSGLGWADDQVYGGIRADSRIRIYAF